MRQINIFSMFLLLVALMLSSIKVNAQEAYAVLSSDNTILTFYYDNQKEQRNGMSIGPFKSTSDVSWRKSSEEINTAIFDDSFAEAKPTSTRGWFNKCSKLSVIIGLKNLNTSQVTDMYKMFFGCHSLQTLDLYSFDTSNVKDMSSMFTLCDALNILDLNNFDTSNVEDMGSMFYGCTSLVSLKTDNFDTSNVEDMGCMFYGCKSLKSLNLRNFNTSKVTDMGGMFYQCNSLTSLDVTSFNTANVENMIIMFMWCENLKEIDLSNFATKNATNMGGMFDWCKSLKTIWVDDNIWNTEKASENKEYSEHLFKGCENIVGGDGTKYDTNHVDISYAHVDGGAVNPGYLTYKQSTIGINSIRQNASNNNKWHTLDGHSVSEPTRSGLYIHNGQKKVIK